MLLYWLWFALLPGLTIEEKLYILQHFQTPEDIFLAQRLDFKRIEGLRQEQTMSLCNKDMGDARAVLAQCAEKHIRVIAYTDSAYPARLRNIDQPPLVLYCKGTVADLESRPVVAVVGTRKATPYGVRTAKSMGAQLAACGAVVISGGAGGIDTAALQGAMAMEKPVAAILAGGVDTVYPKENKFLFEAIAENGCLLSEYPPGTPSYRWHFPRRNRLMSGLSNAVLVVEAPEGSGALITAEAALEQGRDVFTVPGNIDSPTFVGSNALMRDGAVPVSRGWEVIKDYEPFYPGMLRQAQIALEPEVPAPVQVAQKPSLPKANKNPIDNRKDSTYSVLDKENAALSEEERQVLAQVPREVTSVDEILAGTDMPSGKVLSILTKLSLKGLIQNHPGRCVSYGGKHG